MKIKSGLKSTELWIGLATALLTYVFPDAPKEAFLVVIAYIGSRGLAKLAANVKEGILSTEFWLTIGATAMEFLTPGLPPEVIYTISTYILGRGVVKAKSR